MKNMLTILVIIATMACNPDPVTPDYFDQTPPGTTPVIFAEGIISKEGRFEHGISFTPDTKELAFGILKSDNRGTIYHSMKLPQGWTNPTIFEQLKNKSVFLPYFTPHGNSLLYAQSKPDSNNLSTTDIWKIEKTMGHWDTSQIIESPVSSTSREANASMTLDGNIYFSSNRNCQTKDNCFTADLFYSKLFEGKYQTVKGIPQLNSLSDEESVFISPEETYILFCRYTDTEYGMDLYISYRDYTNNWTEPQILDSTINSKEWDRRPFVSMDNKLLFFTQLQIGSMGLIESDIYWVNTSKVFTPFVYNPPADTILQIGQKFEITLPKNYFKHITDDHLTMYIDPTQHEWLTFDRDRMKLSGLPITVGDFDLTITATDKFSNTTKHKMKLTVN